MGTPRTMYYTFKTKKRDTVFQLPPTLAAATVEPVVLPKDGDGIQRHEIGFRKMRRIRDEQTHPPHDHSDHYKFFRFQKAWEPPDSMITVVKTERKLTVQEILNLSKLVPFSDRWNQRDRAEQERTERERGEGSTSTSASTSTSTSTDREEQNPVREPSVNHEENQSPPRRRRRLPYPWIPPPPTNLLPPPPPAPELPPLPPPFLPAFPPAFPPMLGHMPIPDFAQTFGPMNFPQPFPPFGQNPFGGLERGEGQGMNYAVGSEEPPIMPNPFAQSNWPEVESGWPNRFPDFNQFIGEMAAAHESAFASASASAPTPYLDDNNLVGQQMQMGAEGPAVGRAWDWANHFQ